MMIPYRALLLVALSRFATLGLASPPDITFLCDEMPEICTNMCWAIRCALPSFPQHLTLDFAGPDVQTQRSVAAGCGNENMCSPYGLNQTGHRGRPYVACNVYPFSSTSESTFPRGHQVTRCVPEEEQCRQRAQLSLLVNKCKKEAEEQQGDGGCGGGGGVRRFSINFGNPGLVKYCNNKPCVNDGLEVQDGAIKRRSEERMFNYDKTRSGLILASIDELDTPSNFTRWVGSSEEIPSDFETWIEEAQGETLQMIGDTVMERVSAQSFMV